MSSIGSARVQLPRDESREHDDRDPERGEGRGAAPPVRRRFDEAVHECADPDDRQQRADRIEPRLLRVARLRDEEVAGDQARR